jgi:hypothetical protein
MRHRIDQPFATRSAAIEPGHVRLGPGLINENQLAGAPARLVLTPFGTSFGNISPVLLGRSEGLFLYVSSSRLSVIHIRPLLAETLCVWHSQLRNSASVASGHRLT